MTRPIVITGYEQLSSLGNTIDELDASLQILRSGVSAYSLHLAGIDPAQVAISQVNWDDSQITAPSKVPMDRGTAMALHVAKGAMAHASVNSDELEPTRLGVYWGSGMAGAHTFDTSSESLYAQHRRLRPTNVVTIMPNAPAAEIALQFKAQGACLTFACACASSAVAIGEAMHALRSGRLDVAIVGGSESMLTPGVIASWQAMRVLAPAADHAQAACRPFDKHRKGFALGEGAGALVIETLDHARLRGAQPLAMLSGFGLSSDGRHITNPDVGGQIRAMQHALDDAQLQASAIDYINAHATATQAGDAAEAQSVCSVFGEYAVPISSTKALHGHLLGASGVVELIISLRSFVTQQLPRAAHLEALDPAFKLRVVTDDVSQPSSGPRHVMSNSFAFGGTNAVLIASRFQD